MRIVQLGSDELNAHKAEIIRELSAIVAYGDEDIEQILVCDECGAEGQKLLRIEVGAEKHPHDLCAACLAKGIQMLNEVTNENR